MDTSEILLALDAQIAQLEQVRQLLSDSASVSAPSTEPAKRRGRPPAAAKALEVKPAGKRTMSEEGKARIAAAQKKRWAKTKKPAKAAVPAVVAKKTTAPAKKAAGKKVAAAVKAAAPAGAATEKVAAPEKKAVAKKTASPAKKLSTGKASLAEDTAAPVNNTVPPSVEETAAEA